MIDGILNGKERNLIYENFKRMSLKLFGSYERKQCDYGYVSSCK